MTVGVTAVGVVYGSIGNGIGGIECLDIGNRQRIGGCCIFKVTTPVNTRHIASEQYFSPGLDAVLLISKDIGGVTVFISALFYILGPLAYMLLKRNLSVVKGKQFVFFDPGLKPDLRAIHIILGGGGIRPGVRRLTTGSQAQKGKCRQ